MKLWFTLFICNLIWAINPSAAKLLVAQIGPELTAWSKYSSALLCYLIYFVYRRLIHSDRVFEAKISTQAWSFIMFIGVCTFFVSPMTQMLGLTASSATTNSILVAMEPLMTVFLAWLILKSVPAKGEVLCLGLALLGFIFVSELSVSSTNGLSINTGDFLILIALFCEAIYSIFAQKLKECRSEVVVAFSMLIGVILLSGIIIKEGFGGYTKLTASGYLALLWLGPIGAAIPYFLWASLIKKGIPLTAMVVTLFMQPLLGVVSAFLIHGEQITLRQIAGGSLILGAVVLQMYFERRRVVTFKE